jgi:hypothetical protein
MDYPGPPGSNSGVSPATPLFDTARAPHLPKPSELRLRSRTVILNGRRRSSKRCSIIRSCSIDMMSAPVETVAVKFA